MFKYFDHYSIIEKIKGQDLEMDAIFYYCLSSKFAKIAKIIPKFYLFPNSLKKLQKVRGLRTFHNSNSFMLISFFLVEIFLQHF